MIGIFEAADSWRWSTSCVGTSAGSISNCGSISNVGIETVDPVVVVVAVVEEVVVDDDEG